MVREEAKYYRIIVTSDSEKNRSRFSSKPTIIHINEFLHQWYKSKYWVKQIIHHLQHSGTSNKLLLTSIWAKEKNTDKDMVDF